MLEIFKFEAMTTPCELQLYTPKKDLATSCAKEILHELKRLEAKYNYFDKNSYLSSLNERKSNILDFETKSLLQRAKQYYKKTNGVFDITVATIKELYKLTSLEELAKQKEKLLPYVGCERFLIKKDKLYFDNEFTKIDLGGFVKEFAVDRAVSIVKKYKIKSALINFGGDIYALGLKPNNEKFKIGIKNPLKKEENLFFIELCNQALTTSASYERNYSIEDKNYSHIISKENKEEEILSSSVVSNSCVECGVYSTSLMIDKSLKTSNKTYLINKDLEVIS